MNYDNIYHTFPDFLKKKGAYEQYLTNLREQGRMTLTSRITREIENRNVREILVSSFSWQRSPEGIDFWQEISDAWYRHWRNYDI